MFHPLYRNFKSAAARKMHVFVFCVREERGFEKGRLDSGSKPNLHPLDRQSYIVVRVQFQFSFCPCWFLLYMCMFLLPVFNKESLPAFTFIFKIPREICKPTYLLRFSGSLLSTSFTERISTAGN